MSPSLKAKSEAIALREEMDKASTNTNFFMLLDRGKNPVHQLGGGVGRDNPVAVVFEGQVLLERVLDTGVGALRSGDAGELVPGIGDARNGEHGNEGSNKLFHNCIS